jgi:IS5 family transposase
VPSVVTTAANVADSRGLPELPHGEKRKGWGDGGCQGQTQAIQQAAPKDRR